MLRFSYLALAFLSLYASSSICGSTKNDYARGKNWACKPGRYDACAVDMTTTVVSENGTLTGEKWKANPKAPVDCLYFYPTVSRQPTANAKMILEPEARKTIRAQFAPFASQCRVFAPLYRQRTVAALFAQLDGKLMKHDHTLAYGDVVDAWNYYLEHDNKGRGVVLIGHSQGATHLKKLIKEHIEGKPVQARLISAMLLGDDVSVAKGKDIGGDFNLIPLCRSKGQTGCIITYRSYRATIPATEFDLNLDIVSDKPTEIGCTNPASLEGGSGDLHAYLGSSPRYNVLGDFSTPQPDWVTPHRRIKTAFVSVPGMLTSECVRSKAGQYLAVTIHADPQGRRASDISGDLVLKGKLLKTWGWHTIDVNLAMGNLLDIVAEQSKTYRLSANPS